MRRSVVLSILKATPSEMEHLMNRIWVIDFRSDFDDKVGEGILAHLEADKKVFWKEMYDEDIADRRNNVAPTPPTREETTETAESAETAETLVVVLKEQMKEMMTSMEVIKEMVMFMDGRLANVEEGVRILQKNDKGKEKARDDDYDMGLGDDDDLGLKDDDDLGLKDDDIYMGEGSGRGGDAADDPVQPSPVQHPHQASPFQPSPVQHPPQASPF